jgi:hypothetical protein
VSTPAVGLDQLQITNTAAAAAAAEEEEDAPVSW